MNETSKELLSKIKVLEEENIALSEKIEYSVLLNVIAESIDRSEDINLIVESVLEKICILKHLPFAALFNLKGKEHQLIHFYQLMGKTIVSEESFRIPDKIVKTTRDEGLLVVEYDDFDEYGLVLVKESIHVRTLLFYHLSSKFFPDAILVFVDNEEDSQLPAMIYLFEQVITYLVEKLDKLYYWTELQKLNNELEDRVARRTADLETLNRTLKAKEKFIRSIYEAAKNVSFTTVGLSNGEPVINSFSPGSVNLFGYTPDEVAGKPLSTLVCGDAIDNMGLFKQGPRRSNLEVKIIQKSGEQVHAMHNSYPVSDSSGNVISELLVCIDISNLKEVQKQLIDAKDQAEKADSLKTNFLQNMSHEIRTPLNAIVGFADLLRKADLDTEKIDEYTSIISRSSDQLLSLVNDILDISKIESGHYEIDYEDVSIWKLLNSLNLQFGPLARKEGLDFVLDLPAGYNELKVKSDFVKLQQVLINLLGNAIKFTETGFLKLSCEKKQGEVVISVSDSGIGIAKEDHEIVFERFRQVDMSSVRAFSGTGLGLYICKTYMNLLGGKIWVESELGKGATFHLSLPDKTMEKQIVSDRELSDHALSVESDIRVLVVEDEDTNFKLLEVYLSEMNIGITHALNGLEALELLQKEYFDLVLMDIQMPVMNGLEATQRIRQFNQDIPVIAITAFAFEDERRQAIDAGCNAHFSKPIKKEVLLKAISDNLPEKKTFL